MSPINHLRIGRASGIFLSFGGAMPPSLYKLLFLVALLIIWKLFGKRIVALVLVRSAAQGALNDIGKKAINAQPAFVNLARNEFPQFTNPAGIDELKNPLVASGFDYVGTFSVDKIPGVKIAMLAKPDDYVTAYIYEHPKAGIWIERKRLTNTPVREVASVLK
jgi:hypothetical protein